MIFKTKIHAGETIKLPTAMQIQEVYTVLDENALPKNLETINEHTFGVHKEPSKDWVQNSEKSFSYYSLIPYRRESVTIVVRYADCKPHTLAKSLSFC